MIAGPCPSLNPKVACSNGVIPRGAGAKLISVRFQPRKYGGHGGPPPLLVVAGVPKLIQNGRFQYVVSRGPAGRGMNRPKSGASRSAPTTVISRKEVLRQFLPAGHSSFFVPLLDAHRYDPGTTEPRYARDTFVAPIPEGTCVLPCNVHRYGSWYQPVL